MNEGWFKLHRCLFKKSIWQNSTPEQKVILITLLGMANHKGREWEWKGKQFKAEPGQFVTSLESILNKCGKGISIQNVRSALKKLEKYNFLTQEVTKTGRLINIVNWGVYQSTENDTNKESNKELTNNSQRANKELTKSQQRTNKELTTNKNVENIKNDKEGEERKEVKDNIPKLEPLNFPSPIYESIYNLVGDVGYRTWFIKSEMSEEDTFISIKANSDFERGIIISKYIPRLQLELNKRIEVS